LGKCILFGVAGIFITQTGTRSIKRLRGLIEQMPFTTVLMLLGFFAIGGVPPTIGFISKLMIFSGVFNSALRVSPEAVAIAVVAITMTVLTVGYSLWTVRRIFFGPLPEGLKEVKEAPPSMTIPLLILAILAILGGIYPRLVMDYLFPYLLALLPT
jgi:NADH:ubiquinone oxidoreductase subunit 5 (subunit L)/multisubunit Na+/H+ antiporter MnhA subunit